MFCLTKLASGYSSLFECTLKFLVLYHTLLQRLIAFSELTEVQPLVERECIVIHRAKHREWGPVDYKELKPSLISDGSRFDRWKKEPDVN